MRNCETLINRRDYSLNQGFSLKAQGFLVQMELELVRGARGLHGNRRVNAHMNLDMVTDA